GSNGSGRRRRDVAARARQAARLDEDAGLALSGQVRAVARGAEATPRLRRLVAPPVPDRVHRSGDRAHALAERLPDGTAEIRAVARSLVPSEGDADLADGVRLPDAAR